MMLSRPYTFRLSPTPKFVWQNSTNHLSFLLIVKESQNGITKTIENLYISIKHLLLKRRKEEKTQIDVIMNDVVFSQDSLLSTILGQESVSEELGLVKPKCESLNK